MANETTTLIQKVTVGAAGASSITFSNIPQSYTDLVIQVSARSDESGSSVTNLRWTFNNSTSGYSGVELYAQTGNGTTGSGNGGTTSSYIQMGYANAPLNTASTFSSTSVYIPNYTSSNNKSMSLDSVQESNGGSVYVDLGAALWSNSAAITSIKVTPLTANFVQYSTAYLYGIAKQGVTPAATSTPYATGGDDITFDGTYWIHTFKSTGTFTPNRALSNVDYLVVAGGGGGAGDVGGGGGAGGLRSTVTATGGGGTLETPLSLVANTGYTVTVGAGGTTSAFQGNQGSNSVFATITSTGGGGGGSGAAGGGSTGGSGGGNRIGGRAGTANQGRAGGTGQNSSPYSAGGGGGASTAGSNGSAGGVGGNGGAGVAVSISGSSVTYAGGGAGNGENGNGTGGSGGGGNVSTPGTANTGGGGGGQLATSSTGTGGSGIVIVRYPA